MIKNLLTIESLQILKILISKFDFLFLRNTDRKDQKSKRKQRKLMKIILIA